jgi:putative phosphoesterase
MTLVAVIADTHIPRGGRRLSSGCLEILARADLILHGGDVTSGQVLEELRALAPVHAVRGNMDDAELGASLPERFVHEVAGARVGMVHDAGPRGGRAERLAAAFRGCDVVVYAHTHVPEVMRHEGIWIVNPGSPTERRSAQTRSLATVRIDERGARPRLIALP